MIKIRKGKPDDSKELIRLIQLADERTEEVASKKVQKYIDSKRGFFILAVESKKIVGYLLFEIKEDEEKVSGDVNKDYSSINWIAVHPDFRNRKIGSKLLKEAMKQSKKYKTKGILLGCRNSVIEFYKKNGFRNIKTYQKPNKKGKLKPYYIMRWRKN